MIKAECESEQNDVSIVNTCFGLSFSICVRRDSIIDEANKAFIKGSCHDAKVTNQNCLYKF